MLGIGQEPVAVGLIGPGRNAETPHHLGVGLADQAGQERRAVKGGSAGGEQGGAKTGRVLRIIS